MKDKPKKRRIRSLTASGSVKVPSAPEPPPRGTYKRRDLEPEKRK